MWKSPHPVPCVQMVVVDKKENMLFLHRSENVRSAKNVWSTPTGMCENGEHLARLIEKELKEELSLQPLDNSPFGVYENIGGDEGAEQWHWVMVVVVVVVEDCNAFVNNEPEKHDEIRVVPMSEIDAMFVTRLQFHYTLANFFSSQMRSLIDYAKLRIALVKYDR